MVLLKELFQDQSAGLTIYLPDCSQSRLWGNLDHAIHKTTHLEIVRRQWVQHDINSIFRFYRTPDEAPRPEEDPAAAIQKYDNIPVETLQYGHLMVKLLMSGPSLLTIWRGRDAIPTLLKLKGKTQPAQADTDTIRGRFWCDNGVCNLMHSSDDVNEAERELAALKLEYWLDEPLGQAPLITPTPVPNSHIAHSGIITICDVVNRLLWTTGLTAAPLQLPTSGDAKETNIQLTEYLRQTAADHPHHAPFINAFLDGDLIATTNHFKTLPLSRWEQFVIQCGVINRSEWLGIM